MAKRNKNRIRSISHDNFDDCLLTCKALENMIKSGKYRMIPTPNAAGEWDVGYVAAEDVEKAMRERQGRVVLATPKEIKDVSDEA